MNAPTPNHLIMEQRLSLITLAANDLDAMRNFYEQKLGWIPEAQNKDIVFYKLNGFLFSITERKFLAELIGVSSEGSGFRGVTFAYNVPTEKEVTDIYDRLKSNGVTILKEPTVPPFGGLFFYFADVEGNILEVAYNTFIPLDDQLNATGHKSIDHIL